LFGNSTAGTTVHTGDVFGDVVVEPFSVAAARECEIVLLAVSGAFATEHAHAITGGSKSTIVIDNSSAFRYTDSVPLVVPEINGRLAHGAPLIANPNCTTAIAAMALWPLHQRYGLRKVIMSTYQAASGAGKPGMDELSAGVVSFAKDGTVPAAKVFAHQLPFNAIPHIDAFQVGFYSRMSVMCQSSLALPLLSKIHTLQFRPFFLAKPGEWVHARGDEGVVGDAQNLRAARNRRRLVHRRAHSVDARARREHRR
jgi:aspartate-semialdehyde dehydrogenase